MAGHVGLGAIFARPALTVGYGKPHWQWFGVETYALTTNAFFATYTSARASLPFLDFTIGVRDTWAYSRPFLPARASYSADDLDHTTEARARYLAVDYKLTGVVPVPSGYALGTVLATTVLDAPDRSWRVSTHVARDSLLFLCAPP